MNDRCKISFITALLQLCPLFWVSLGHAPTLVLPVCTQLLILISSTSQLLSLAARAGDDLEGEEEPSANEKHCMKSSGRGWKYDKQWEEISCWTWSTLWSNWNIRLYPNSAYEHPVWQSLEECWAFVKATEFSYTIARAYFSRFSSKTFFLSLQKARLSHMGTKIVYMLFSCSFNTQPHRRLWDLALHFKFRVPPPPLPLLCCTQSIAICRITLWMTDRKW